MMHLGSKLHHQDKSYLDN